MSQPQTSLKVAAWTTTLFHLGRTSSFSESTRWKFGPQRWRIACIGNTDPQCKMFHDRGGLRLMMPHSTLADYVYIVLNPSKQGNDGDQGLFRIQISLQQQRAQFFSSCCSSPNNYLLMPVRDVAKIMLLRHFGPPELDRKCGNWANQEIIWQNSFQISFIKDFLAKNFPCAPDHH